jgi:hypothetical protein
MGVTMDTETTKLEKMAIEAGFDVSPGHGIYHPDTGDEQSLSKYLARFADLVRQEERERCAWVCDVFKEKALEQQRGDPNDLSNVMLRQVAVLGFGEVAVAIRSGG